MKSFLQAAALINSPSTYLCFVLSQLKLEISGFLFLFFLVLEHLIYFLERAAYITIITFVWCNG